MINLKDESDVQIWCDFQEETKQTDTNFFLRLRFSNFRTFLATVTNYDDGDGFGFGSGNNYSGNGFGFGYGYGYNGSGYGNGNGCGYGYESGDGNGRGDGSNRRGDGKVDYD